MNLLKKRFELRENRWYAWEMLPGYGGGVPYFPPILIESVHPLGTGKGLLRVEFFNAFYAEGVQDFRIDLRILKRADEYLICEIIQSSEDRTAIIAEISFDWLGFVLSKMINEFPPQTGPARENVKSYLDRVFNNRVERR